MRDSFRRIADSDPGRVVDGRLYPHGRWRYNDQRPDLVGLTEEDSPLVLVEEQLVVTPRSQGVETLVTTQVEVVAYEGSVLRDEIEDASETYALSGE